MRIIPFKLQANNAPFAVMKSPQTAEFPTQTLIHNWS
jgi:hypothetical protein